MIGVAAHDVRMPLARQPPCLLFVMLTMPRSDQQPVRGYPPLGVQTLRFVLYCSVWSE
jgi:hypothetical protein